MPPASTRRRSGLIGLAVCLLVVVALVWAAPTPSSERELLVVSAAAAAEPHAADRIVVDDVAVRLLEVRVADRLTVGTRDPVVAHDGTVLVAAIWQLEVTGDPVTPTTELRVDGLSYAERPEFVTAAIGTTQPGFTATGTAVYEVPRDRLGRVTMVVIPRGGVLLTYRKLGGFALDLGAWPAVPSAEVPEPALAATP